MRLRNNCFDGARVAITPRNFGKVGCDDDAEDFTMGLRLRAAGVFRPEAAI